MGAPEVGEDRVHPFVPGRRQEAPAARGRVVVEDRHVVGEDGGTEVVAALVRGHHVAESAAVVEHVVPGQREAPARRGGPASGGSRPSRAVRRLRQMSGRRVAIGRDHVGGQEPGQREHGVACAQSERVAPGRVMPDDVHAALVGRTSVTTAARLDSARTARGGPCGPRAGRCLPAVRKSAPSPFSPRRAAK